MVMVQHGYNTTFDGEGNQLYAVNGIPFHYLNEPIRVQRDELVRIYLVNMLEYDPINSFHIHGNFFDYFPTGTRLEPTEFTDTVIQGQAQRGICELRFPHAGPVHVPRPQDRVRRARLDGLLRGRGLIGGGARRDDRALRAAARRCRPGAWSAGALALIAAVLVALAVAGGDSLPERLGPPVEELAVERTELTPGRIELTVRNTGPDAVQIAQVFVNDAYVDFQGADGPIGRLGSADRSRSTTRGRRASRTWSRW